MDLVIKLFENIGINKYIIELIKGKQLSYRPIYAFSLIKLDTLKTYIKTPKKPGLYGYLSFLLVFISLLIKNLMITSTCILITEVL